MSDAMFYGVLRMPYDLAMSSDMSRRQFYSRVQEALARLEAAEADLARLRMAVQPIPETVFMRPMSSDDGRNGWYVDGPGFYCDIEPNNEGQYSVFFRDKDGKEGYAEQPVIQPLTDGQIISLAYDCNALPEVITDKSLTAFARAVEFAHGITPTGDKK